MAQFGLRRKGIRPTMGENSRLVHREIQTGPRTCGTIAVNVTPEERFERIERQLELAVGQQGQFYTDLRQLAELVGNQGKQLVAQQGQISQIVTAIGRMSDVIGEVLRIQERTQDQMRETDRRLQETDRRLQDTDRRLQDTDQRLNVLINVVERYIAHNGHGPAESPPSA